jgi:hypothetical protein
MPRVRMERMVLAGSAAVVVTPPRGLPGLFGHDLR